MPIRAILSKVYSLKVLIFCVFLRNTSVYSFAQVLDSFSACLRIGEICFTKNGSIA